MYNTPKKQLKNVSLVFGTTAFIVSALICSIMVFNVATWSAFGLLLLISATAGISSALLSRKLWTALVQNAPEPARWRPFAAGASTAILAYLPTFLVAGLAVGLHDGGNVGEGLAFGLLAAMYGIFFTGWGTGFVGGMAGAMLDKRLNPDAHTQRRVAGQETGAAHTSQDHGDRAKEDEVRQDQDPYADEWDALEREESASDAPASKALDPLSDEYDPLLAEFAKLEEQMAQEEEQQASAFASSRNVR